MNIQEAIQQLDSSIYNAELKRQTLLKHINEGKDIDSELRRVSNLISETNRLNEEFVEAPVMKKVTIGDWFKNTLIGCGLGLTVGVSTMGIIDLLGAKVRDTDYNYAMFKGSVFGIVYAGFVTIVNAFQQNNNRKTNNYLEKRKETLEIEKLLVTTSDLKTLKALTARKEQLEKECTEIQDELTKAFKELEQKLKGEIPMIEKKLATAK